MSDSGFKPYPQCVQCLLGLAKNAAVLAGRTGKDTEGRAEVLARAILGQAESEGLSSPEAANDILRELRTLLGERDPYRHFKEKEMSTARNIQRRMCREQGRDLRRLVELAAVGNSLDFFKQPETVSDEISAVMGKGLPFSRNDTARLEAFLAGAPDLVLYLSDNAGEIYFDLPLFRHLQEKVGRVVLVVKGGPALNDLTRSELAAAGLEGDFREIADTGADGAGVDWRHVSQDFLRLVGEADLILSKGMANFETLHEKPLPCPTFFLFKVKCRPIEKYLGAPQESFVALWRDAAASPRGHAG